MAQRLERRLIIDYIRKNRIKAMLWEPWPSSIVSPDRRRSAPANLANGFSPPCKPFPGLDSNTLKRHLALGGFGESRDIEKVALKTNAPFLSELSPERAELLWSGG